MKYFLDLEVVAPRFHEAHGLLPLDTALAESMIANGAKWEEVQFGPFTFISIKVTA